MNISQKPLPEHMNFRQPVACVRFDWVVLMATDCFGTGYLAHHDDYVNEATSEGWVIVATEMTKKEAFEYAELLSRDEVCISEAVWS